MSKYACSTEGVASLRSVTDSINESIIFLNEMIADVKFVIEPYSNELGPHYDQLLETFNKIVECLNGSYDSAQTVGLALARVIEIYEEVISRTPKYVDADTDNGTAYSIGAKTR